MNSPQAKLLRKRNDELKAATDLKKYKTELIEKVITKTIVKEQHADVVRALQFNHTPGAPVACGNLFATIGGDFATVYDDEHFGDHVAVVVQFKNDPTEYTKGGEFTALCWLDANGYSPHEFGDALLAVAGGDDHAVQVISVTEGRVLNLMKGHGADILALAAGTSSASPSPSGEKMQQQQRARPEILVSLSLDGTAILWNWRTGERLLTYVVHDAVSVAVKPDGTGMYTGHKDGKVREWTFPADLGNNNNNKKRAQADSLTAEDAGAVVVPIGPAHHAGVAVDCIRILPPAITTSTTEKTETDSDPTSTSTSTSSRHRLVTKSVNGAMHVYDAEARVGVSSWKVPGVVKPRAADVTDTITSFNADPKGEFIAVGNTDGEVLVYDVVSGEVLKSVEQDRDFKALNLVRASAVSADCRHVLACFGPGIVWRMEVVPELEELVEREGVKEGGGPGTPPEGGDAPAPTEDK